MKGSLITIWCLFLHFALFSQYRPIEKEEWQKAVDGLDYNEKTSTPEADQVTPPEMQFAPEPFLASDIAKIVLFIAVGALLAFILIRLFGKDIFARNKKITSRQIVIHDLEERPMESDLERFLREALQRKDFRQAIRIYYLIILKSLHDKNLIRWKKDKTNMQYLSEMNKHPSYAQLINNTLLFEYIWYGEHSIGEEQFFNIKKSFTSLLEKLNNPGRWKRIRSS